MREANLPRFENPDIGRTNSNYLVYCSLVSALRRAAKHAHGELLDIGCGNKPYESFFRNQVSSYLGCDIVQSSLCKVDVQCLATDIPLHSGSFDTVLTTQTIEHVTTPNLLLAEAFRLLRPNGVLILSGPMYWHLHEEPFDFFRFTKHGFNYLLESCGFEVIAVLPNGGKWATLGQVLIHAFQPIRGPFRLLLWPINFFFEKLDRLWFDDINTMNYVVIARRPK